MHLILYSKPGCHLCEGLQEKLTQIQTIKIDLEIRDITTQDDWFQMYQYEIPVLFIVNPDNPQQMQMIPRPSPRTSVSQLDKILQRYL
ncbi:glutaredoxin family protein [Calothrix sp. NIES-3974]|uniref:glutaredoxin family protein n=1 Tax=Calothrix sp. NIES-3974 TaxID=2005462 RepID=UPI000BBCC212|nr:glutaredoxin family protein [Calothrix sp. NIES-3974]